MNGIIIYKGKYGATRQYARWLGHELQLPVVSSLNVQGKQLISFDYMIIGTSVYYGKLQIKDWLKENADYIKGKKVFFFQVAGTPSSEIEKRVMYNTSSIPMKLIPYIKFFFLDGKMNLKKLSWFDRFMLKMGARFTGDPKARENMLKEFNLVNKENLSEILSAIRTFLKPLPANGKAQADPSVEAKSW